MEIQVSKLKMPKLPLDISTGAHIFGLFNLVIRDGGVTACRHPKI